MINLRNFYDHEWKENHSKVPKFSVSQYFSQFHAFSFQQVFLYSWGQDGEYLALQPLSKIFQIFHFPKVGNSSPPLFSSALTPQSFLPDIAVLLGRGWLRPPANSDCFSIKQITIRQQLSKDHTLKGKNRELTKRPPDILYQGTVSYDSWNNSAFIKRL